MRSFLTLGVLSLVGAAAIVACGDDDPPSTGNGGSAGGSQGGSGGANGGSGGDSAGSAGASGTPGQGGGGGGPGPDLDPIATCTGCVELIAPVTGPNDNSVNPPVNVADQVSFIFTIPAASSDFSNGVITWRVMALENNANLQLNFFAQNGMPQNYAGIYPITLALSAVEFPPGQWRDVVLDLSQYEPIAGGDAGAPAPADAGDGGALLPNNGFDKSLLAQFGITLGINATTTGSAVVRVAVDSVGISGVTGQVDHTFATGVEGLGINMYQVPPGTPPPFFHAP